MNSTHSRAVKVTGAILAGGEARRMGGRDKGLVELHGRPLIEHTLARFQPQVDTIIINANRNASVYRRYAEAVVGDQREGFNGPLAGMASCLKAIDSGVLATVPCDAPLLPTDLVSRLAAALEREDARIAVAHNGERLQPVFCLLHRELLESVEQFLQSGERKIDKWFALHETAIVDFSDSPGAFVNVNSPEDIHNLELEIRGS